MTEKVRYLAWLNAPVERPEGDNSKAPLKSRLQSMRDNRKDENYTPDMPPTNAGEYLVAYLFEVGPTMASGMGMGPVTHQEIAAWQSLTGIPLTPWDARAIRRLSIEYSNWSIKAASADCKAPWMPEDHTVDKAQVANSMRDAMRKLAEI